MRATNIYYTSRIHFSGTSVGRTRRHLEVFRIGNPHLCGATYRCPNGTGISFRAIRTRMVPLEGHRRFRLRENGQNPDQQLKDESECYGAAQQMTGIDPKAPAAAGKTAEQKAAEQKEAANNANQVKGTRVAGAARGAAGGAAIGAIAGDAGKGAGAGAVAGTMRGGMQQRQANAASQKQAAAQTAAKQQKEEEALKAAHAQGLDTFQRAFEACMDARGYSVK
jgi:hypothetical protein